MARPQGASVLKDAHVVHAQVTVVLLPSLQPSIACIPEVVHCAAGVEAMRIRPPRQPTIPAIPMASLHSAPAWRPPMRHGFPSMSSGKYVFVPPTARLMMR